MREKQVGGNHYKMAIEPIDFIVKNQLGYREGNVIKYVVRHDKKNGAQDIKKAIHYLEMILEDYEREATESWKNPELPIERPDVYGPVPHPNGWPFVDTAGYREGDRIPIGGDARLGADTRDSSQLPEVSRDKSDPRQLPFDW